MECPQTILGGGCREYQCNRIATGPGSQVPKLQSLASPNPGTICLHKETIPFCKILEPLSSSTKCWETECKHKPALIDKAHLGACRIEDNELPFVIQLLVNHPNIIPVASMPIMEHNQNPSAPTNIAIGKSQENLDKRMQAQSVEFRMILMQQTFHSVVSMLVEQQQLPSTGIQKATCSAEHILQSTVFNTAL